MTASSQPVEILAVGMVTPVGLDAPRTAAAVRAGLSRARESKIHNKAFKLQIASQVPDNLLTPLADSIGRQVWEVTARDRMVQLAAQALVEVLQDLPGRMPALYLAVPEKQEGSDDRLDGSFVTDLRLQSDLAFDPGAVTLYRRGGAGGLYALRDALALLRSGRADLALVGGVDSFFDTARIDALDDEDRLLGEGIVDGFIPGEGAGVLLLARPDAARRLGRKPLARILGVGLGAEEGHRYSPEPYRGEGLAAAFRELFAGLPAGVEPVRCVYAGFNGESLPAKEWGVSFLRSSSRFADDFRIEHPADCLGETGAAAGTIMMGLATIGLQRRYRSGPCLVWCTSDREARAAALLQAI